MSGETQVLPGCISELFMQPPVLLHSHLVKVARGCCSSCVTPCIIVLRVLGSLGVSYRCLSQQVHIPLLH
jgi:hypothetical protein